MSQRSAIPRASTFAVPSSRRGGRGAGADVAAAASERPHGVFNAARDVPPPAIGAAAASGSSFSSVRGGGGGSSAMMAGAVGGPGGRAGRAEKGRAGVLLTKAVVMVDEATEPGISDEEGVRRRVALVELVQSGGDPRHGDGNSPGAAVAHAMRKRLKSDDHVAVLNCLTLLDETMRYCPYFYRYIANEKFFRRLWRFVDPEYKPDPRGRLPFSTANKMTKMVAASRTSAVNIELAERVLILLRAWAEELSIMLSGQQDPDAGFFIERYSAKRTRIKFPDLPPSSVPWVCPVGPTAGRSRFASYGGTNGTRRGTTSTTRSPLPKSLSLGEIENTVNLFSNLLEKASDISEVRGDLCTDLADRCRLISQHIDTLSATMEKEEDLARAVKVSEQLQSALSVYDTAIASGELAKAPVVVVDGLSSDGNSVDEGYDVGPSSYAPAVAYNGDRADRGDEGSSRRRDASAGSSSSAPLDRRRSMDSDDYSGDRPSGSARDKTSTRKREKKEALKLSGSSSKSSVKSSKSSTKKESSKQAAAKAVEAAAPPSLVDVAGLSSTKSSSSASSVEKKDSTAFNILEKRYTSGKSTKSTKSNKSSMTGATPDLSAVQSSMVVPGFSGMSVGGPVSSPPASYTSQAAQVTPQPPTTRAAPQPQQAQQFQQQQQQPQMPYGSVMMMPNPMAMSMYGSYNPAMMQQPQPYGGMPSAYNTVNPGMYYNTVNPLAYASVGVTSLNPGNGVPPTAAPGQSQSVPQTSAEPTAPFASSVLQAQQQQAQQSQAQQAQAQHPEAQQPQAQQAQALQPQAQQSQAQQPQTQQSQALQPQAQQPQAQQLQAQQLQALQPQAQQPQAQQPAQQPQAQQPQAQQPRAQEPEGQPLQGQQPPQSLQSNLQYLSQAPQSQPSAPQVPHAGVAPQQFSQVQPPLQEAPQLQAFPQTQPFSPTPAVAQQTPQMAGFGMNVVPVPPPPPLPSAYTTVTNAPAPPPQEPPPPASSSDVASTGLSAPPVPAGQPAMPNQSFLYASGAQQSLHNAYPSMTGVAANPGIAQYTSVSGVPAMTPAMAMGANPQAMAYQNAMANAAAAYHAAATAYQSVQGQAPLQPADTTSASQDSSTLSPNVSQQ